MDYNCPKCDKKLKKNSSMGFKEIKGKLYVMFIASCECSNPFYVKMPVNIDDISTME